MGLFAGAAGIASAVGGGLAAAAPAIGGISGLVSAGTGIASAITGSNTAKQTEGQVNDLYQPYNQAGVGALNQINTLLSPGNDVMSTLESQPGYQAGYDQGQIGVERAENAAGTLNSGGTLKASTRYGQDYATNTYQNILNNLYKVAGMGEASLGPMADNIASGNTSANAALNQGIGAGVNGLNALLNGGSGGTIPTTPIGNIAGNSPVIAANSPILSGPLNTTGPTLPVF